MADNNNPFRGGRAGIGFTGNSRKKGGVSFTGDWDTFQRTMRGLYGAIEVAAGRANLNFAIQAEAYAVKHLQAQDLGWHPLSETYKRWKISHGYSEKMLIMTSQYMQAITSWQAGKVPGVKGLLAQVGVRRDVRRRDGKLLFSVVAVHEFGNGRVRARPLWKPTERFIVTYAQNSKILQKFLVEEFRKL